ncbi:RNase H domain-containing protein [Caerostris extrusa]|uniref:RNase H domain-containing protein n=1 Tax=Caerostris extrusa TaxID=172846 RepID=A0AAV4PVE7_CAEEX|nr:RNase H domain-containing protein [Caerostris extrusa]
MWQGMNSENFNSSVKYENTGMISSPFQVKTLPLIKKFHNKFINEEPSIYCTSSPLYIIICQKTESPSITEEAFIISNCSEDGIIYDLKPDWEYNLNEEELFKCYDFSANNNAIKAVNTRDGNYIVFLNQKHFINIMCSYTFVVLETLGNHNGKGSIKDFVLNEAVDQNSCLVSDCKIGLLMETESENFTHVFEIRKFPSFELIYSFNLSQFAKIAECKPNQDFWYLIDGSVLEDSGEKYLTDLSLKAVSEALPEARLLGLVNRRKFVEAEKLAKESDLNFEVIYKTKFKCILNDLSLNKYINSSESEIDNVWKELLEVLNHIKDVEFVKSAILYPLTNASFMKKLLFVLKTGSKVAAELINNEEVQSIQDVISQINKVLNKITTHEIISKDNESYLNLKDFLAKDLSDYLISEFQNGNLNTTFIIWQRHKDELLLSLNEDSIKQILQALPDLLPSQHLISFLCDDFYLLYS